MEHSIEEPTRKRQRRNAIRPNSEETRAIRTVADEFQMRTAIDIMNSLSVNEQNINNNNNNNNSDNVIPLPHNLHNILNQISVCNQLFDLIPTTAIYADSECILPSSAITITNENNGLKDHGGNNDNNNYYHHNQNQNENISLPIALPIVAALKPEDLVNNNNNNNCDCDDDDDDLIN